MAIEVELQPDVVAVAPGDRGFWDVRVRNTGSVPVQCPVRVGGDVAEWAWVTTPEVKVDPGTAETVRVGVRLPPPPTPAAGRIPFPVHVGDVTTMATLEVVAVVDVVASLGHAAGKRWARPLTVRNRGNTPAVVALSVEGGAVSPSSISVAPGELAMAQVTARGEFAVHVRPEGGPETVVSGTAARPARGRFLRWPVLVPVGAAVLLVAGLLVSRAADSGRDDSVVAGSAAESSDCPVRDHFAAEANGMIRRGLEIPQRYAFLEARQGGCHPVRFNPCEPIHYVVNSALAPPGALDDLAAAMRQVEAATGITFHQEGTTDEPAAVNRRIFQPERYGNRWAPVLIVWDHGAQHRMEDTNPGGGRAFNVDGVYVSGVLIVNVDAVTDERRRTPVPGGFGEGATWGRVFIHELAHLLGLGHVARSDQIMFADLGLQRGRAEFHEGDLEGLRLIGKEAGCVPTPTRG